MDEVKNENKFVKWLKWFFFSFIWLGVLLLVLDLVSKLCIVNFFGSRDPSDGPLVIIPGFLRLIYVTNSKSAFGLGVNQPTAHRIIFIIIALVGAGFAIGFYAKKFKSLKAIVKASLMLIAVGALGNMIDRIFYSASFLTNDYLIDVMGVENIHDGAVVDWIDFYFTESWQHNLWAYPFNIADSCVVVGTIMLIVYLIVDEIKLAVKKHKEEVKEEQEKVLSQEEKRRLAEEQKEFEIVVEEKPIEEKPAPEEAEKKEE